MDSCKRESQGKVDILPSQDVPDIIKDGWEDRLIIATWYTKDYKQAADKLRASCDRFMKGVRFVGFEFEPKEDNRRSAILSRPLQIRRICDVVSPEKSILVLDADTEFIRKPTRKELAHLIGFEGCGRIATTTHSQITNHYSPCLATLLFRGHLAHQFMYYWADMMERFWEDYKTNGVATCNGSFNQARSKRKWKESSLWDGTLSRIWNSTPKYPDDNPVILNSRHKLNG